MCKVTRCAALICLVILPCALVSAVLSQLDLFITSAFDEASDRFYTCPDSFTMQSRHQAVRCIRYPQENFVAAKTCPTDFTSRQTDYRDHQDMCLNDQLKTADLTCPQDTQIYIQPGEDLCVKRLGGAIVAPDVLTKR